LVLVVFNAGTILIAPAVPFPVETARFHQTDIKLGKQFATSSEETSTAGGLPPLIGVINLFNQGKSGDRLMRRSLALFGAVAVMLTVTIFVTFSRATLSAGGVGSLKCYNTSGIEKTC
jgi:hypothetical protein